MSYNTSLFPLLTLKRSIHACELSDTSVLVAAVSIINDKYEPDTSKKFTLGICIVI